MKILVVGFGVAGKDLYNYLKQQNHDVSVCDDFLQGDRFIQELTPFDLAIHSPGVPMTSPWIQKIQAANIPLISEAEFAILKLEGTLVGITGTNGKTTTTLFLEYVLKQEHLAIAIGNNGVSFAKYLQKPLPNPILLLELSSYQLEHLKTAQLDVGVILNISQDHLDRYSCFEDYVLAKIKMQEFVKPEGTLFVEYNTYRRFSKYFTREVITFGYEKKADLTIGRDFLQNANLHDRINIFVAAQVLKALNINPVKAIKAYQTFQKPEHRLEFIDTIEGVHFFNDSKATNVDAVKAAVLGLKHNRIFLIMGGEDKNSDFRALKKTLKTYVKHLFVIGKSAQKIKQVFEKDLPITEIVELEKAVQCAFEMAKAQDAILLSPGCASFDQFENYVDRGNKFRYTVNKLKKGVSS